MTLVKWLIQIEGSLIVQIVVFLLLSAGIAHLLMKVNTVIRQLAAERTEAISEVQRIADELTIRTAGIIEQIEETNAVIHHELKNKEGSAEPTVRDQIAQIKEATDLLTKNGSEAS